MKFYLPWHLILIKDGLIICVEMLNYVKILYINCQEIEYFIHL